MPDTIKLLKDNMQQKLDYAAAHSLNSVRGAILGEGQVQNCFVLGTVTTDVGAIVANCVIDRFVSLQVEKGARVCNCSFHPLLIDNKLVPVCVIIRKNATAYYVWSADDFELGANSVMAFTKVHDCGNSYRMLQAQSTTIGENCVVYGSTIDARDDADSPRATCLTIGNNSILWQALCQLNRSTVAFGDNAILCESNLALKLRHGKIAVLTDTDNGDCYAIHSTIREDARFDCAAIDLKTGTNFYLGTSFCVRHTYDKLKDARCVLGNDVNIVALGQDNNTDHTLQINVHNLKTGDRVILAPLQRKLHSKESELLET